MKSLLHITLLLMSCIFLWGCPYESWYAIDNEPQQNIDESLLGKWAAMVPRPTTENDYKESPVKIVFDKRSDLEYDVAITGYIDELRRYRVVENDSIKGTAFISLVDNRPFLNLLVKGKTYIIEIKKEGNTLSLFTLAEHFTNKYVKNSDELRSAISIHYKARPLPLYDEWFALKNLQKVN